VYSSGNADRESSGPEGVVVAPPVLPVLKVDVPALMSINGIGQMESVIANGKSMKLGMGS
jgi:hypothetical protein